MLWWPRGWSDTVEALHTCHQYPVPLLVHQFSFLRSGEVQFRLIVFSAAQRSCQVCSHMPLMRKLTSFPRKCVIVALRDSSQTLCPHVQNILLELSACITCYYTGFIKKKSMLLQHHPPTPVHAATLSWVRNRATQWHNTMPAESSARAQRFGAAIARTLSTSTQPQLLSLMSSGLSENLSQFSAGISNLCCLAKLWLMRTVIGPNSACELSKYLSSHTSLADIVFCDINVGDRSGKALS